MKKEIIEASLIERLRKGSKGAFREFAELFAPRFLKLAETAGLDREHAKDITQDIMVHIFTRLDHFKPGYHKEMSVSTAFTRWVMKIARNAIMDTCRARRKLIEVPSLDELDVVYTQSEMAKRSIEWAIFNKALKQLTLKEKEFLMLHYSNGYSVKEIASRWGEKISSCNLTLARANQKVIKAMHKSICLELEKRSKHYSFEMIKLFREVEKRLRRAVRGMESKDSKRLKKVKLWETLRADGYNYSEIAQETGSTEAAVKQHFYRLQRKKKKRDP